ncbi:MAG: hypothetical protein KAI47_03445 [Deltaproteobacteria bacterium]|nr:hypothetical protein [Deltaproteobacteria bacterium]
MLISRRHATLVALLFSLAAVFLLPSVTWARRTPVVSKSVRFAQVQKDVVMSVGFRELFDAKLRRRLKSGFATTAVMRVYLYRVGGGRPLIALARRLSVVYDLWDEQFRLKIEDPRGTHTFQERDLQKVVDRLSSFRKFPLLPYSTLSTSERYFVAGIIEVNPMSAELLAAVRRWLRKPARRQVGGNSIFGSFVSLFVNDKIKRAEKTFKFRSQPFFRQKPFFRKK